MRRISVAPSDFAYLFNECPRCWWLKTRKLAPFKEPFPKTFSDIDRAMKAALAPDEDSGSTKWLDTLNALGVPVTGCVPFEKVASAPIPFPEYGVEIEIFGRIDRAYEEKDGFAVIDFKASELKSTAAASKFSAQLHCYQWCIEHPKKGAGREVTRLGTVTFAPSGMKIAAPDNDFGIVRCAFSGVLAYAEVPIDRSEFFDCHLRRAAELAGPDELPKAGEGCARCFAVAEAQKYERDHAKRIASTKEAA